MTYYPDVTHGYQFSFLFFAIDDSGDFLISVSAGAHVGGGGFASAAFNVTEFIERLYD